MSLPSKSPSPVNHLKRKEPDSDSDDADQPSPKSQCKPIAEPTSISGTSSSSTAPVPVRPDEYEAGRVICEACGTGVSFRDDDSGGFTLKHWEAHRITCPAASQRPPAPPIAYAPSTDPLSTHLSTSLHASAPTIPSASGGPHAPKRRRAKRTEEERIEYLRADPYVGQFEAYRVLCASCDKWIRLRPNSTYCSIPWDAHRKSCLAKKITTKNPYALSERNSLFAKDPDVRKFDPERLLCNICDRWLSLPPDDHLGAVQRWLSHRAGCGRAPGQLADANSTAPGNASANGGRSPGTGVHPGPGEGSEHHPPSASLSPRSPSSATQPAGTRFIPPAIASLGTASTAAPPALAPLTTTSTSTAAGAPRASPPSPYLLTPLTYAPAHESRRRNAEQRAATLRADRLIGRVEPNRVFCSLCEKWVQLRQDSSYCAYPWVQHRGKCLRRSERRNAKAAELAHMKGGPAPAHLTHSSGRRLTHGSHASHSTHPSQSSSHSGLGFGYPSAHQHHQQRYQGNAHGHRQRMGHEHGHGRHAAEDEDQLMSDGEDDGERGANGAPHGLSASPSLSVSASEDEGETKYRARNREHDTARREDDSDGAADEDAEDAADVESEEEDPSAVDVKPQPHSMKPYPSGGKAKEKDAHHARRATVHARPDDPARRTRHAPSVNGNGTAHAHHPAHRPRGPHHNGVAYSANTTGRMSHAVAGGSAPYRSSTSGRSAASMGMTNGMGGVQRAWDGAGDDVDAEGEPDAEAEWIEEMEAGGKSAGAMNRGVPRRPWPVGLADLDSPAGRKHFIQTSLTHLFSTTYEPADELSVSALLTYLNAAMPPDKHEDFDTAEVARAVAALAERGKVVFEGDLVRVVE